MLKFYRFSADDGRKFSLRRKRKKLTGLLKFYFLILAA
ncbi:hypothetical protein CAMRE0001_2189 [Campylobacter rectus RM3267]|uniref:Uncharacterized protein n=1 Tax=Campylobacter rectus RM3267 TaxID=553218 RepID=B9D492_CAMRE|nr:hypothetical protein CAMRE0001_2189 [Campylobacter rectus RM3267]